jgi:hypothetical protein
MRIAQLLPLAKLFILNCKAAIRKTKYALRFLPAQPWIDNRRIYRTWSMQMQVTGFRKG